MSGRRLLALVLAAATLPACSSSPPEVPPGSGSDIVLPAPGDGEPLVELLVIEESEDGPLLGSRGWHALGNGGQIYVTDFQAKQVHEFAAGGGFVRSIGAPGEAPGEFLAPVMLYAVADSLYVYDNRSFRVSVFDQATGTFQRSQGVTIDGVLANQLLGVGPGGFAVSYSHSPNLATDGVVDDDEIRMVPFGAGGAARSEVIWRTPGVEWVPYEMNGFQGYRVKPYGKRSMCTFLGDRGYCGHTASLRIHVFSARGDSLFAVTVPTEPRAVTAQEREAALERIPSEALRAQLVVAESHPMFYPAPVVDNAGRIWLQRTSGGDTTEFWILDPEANTSRSVTLRGDARLYDIRAGRAVAQVLDDDGLWRTRVFAVPDR